MLRPLISDVSHVSFLFLQPSIHLGHRRLADSSRSIRALRDPLSRAGVEAGQDDGPGRSALAAAEVDDDATDSHRDAPLAPGPFGFLRALMPLLKDRPPVDTGASGSGAYVASVVQVISEHPRIYLYPRFIDDESAHSLVEVAEKRLAPSALALKRGETAEATKEVRTSSGTFMDTTDDPSGALARMEERIAALTMLPRAYGETWNVLRYDKTQHYHSHYDAFPEEDYGKQRSQRIATVLIYLTDVEEGGETTFLLEGEGGLKHLSHIDYTSCNATGIRVKPRKGDAVVFWSAFPDGSIDKHALHGGCPVIQGTKWAAVKWLRNKCIAGKCERGEDTA